jgi:hypothetical protein
MTRGYAKMEESNLEQHGIIIISEKACQDLKKHHVDAHTKLDREKQSLIAQIQD